MNFSIKKKLLQQASRTATSGCLMASLRMAGGCPSDDRWFSTIGQKTSLFNVICTLFFQFSYCWRNLFNVNHTKINEWFFSDKSPGNDGKGKRHMSCRYSPNSTNAITSLLDTLLLFLVGKTVRTNCNNNWMKTIRCQLIYQTHWMTIDKFEKATWKNPLKKLLKK